MKRTWQQVLNDQAEAREDRSARRSIAINMPNSLFSLVSAAARQRGMSFTSYARRAVLAFAQADLGFDWSEEMQAEPGVAAINYEDRPFKGGVKTSGKGYGPWKIVGLEEHEPDA